jgi:2-methylcitrate dehydratase
MMREVRYAKGHPKNTLTDQEIEIKFRKLTKPVMVPAQVNIALEKLWRLEEINDLSEIISTFEL